MPDNKSSAAIRPVGCAVLGLFAVMLWLSCLMISSVVLTPRERQSAALAWPETPCVIQKLDIKIHKMKSSRPVRSSSGRRSSSSTAFSPEVTFEYEVDGQTYTSQVFWLGGTLFNTSEDVAEIIAPYQVGAPAVCYVNPQNPEDAILSRQLYDEEWVGWWFFIVFGLVGAAGCAAGMWAIFFPRGWRQAGGAWARASRGEVLGGWIAALAWNGLFGTLFVLACLRGVRWSSVVELLGFPFLGLLLLSGAVLKTWQYFQVAAPDR